MRNVHLSPSRRQRETCPRERILQRPRGPGPEGRGRELPLLDPAVLRELEDQLGAPDIAVGFARDYATLWGQRQGHLVAAVERQDRERALDAVISLKISSAMVGGLRMALLAEAVEASFAPVTFRADGRWRCSRTTAVPP